ncbi:MULTISPECIES: helix-turn-helix transcriptional regulator [unclassified Arthrobacter]|uniref:helix-turn-helix transcriptional regulator n=1 Tax=unclassified Arthrobacter TaxID=235627 RepID=UPI0006FBF507|nr:WYL domain-containing protein [Arthrobacter sp. Leaf234]KQO03196.1 transcriptional regulator [Arthrobacter sp. Leaf234]
MATTSSRLLTLLSLLQTRRDWPGALLAERTGVSHRTVRRDVDRLRELGYSIRATMGPDGGYRLDAGSTLPPLLFDDDQALALAVALRSAVSSQPGVGEAALRALATVRQVLPARLRPRLDALEFTALPPSGRDVPDPPTPQVLLALSAAVRAQQVLRFDYAGAASAAPQGSDGPRRVEPHHLVTHGGRWYLVAWDLEREDWRIFRADRTTPKLPTGPRFTPRELPDGGVAGFVSRRFTGAADGGGWPCVGTVVLGRPAGEVLPFAGDGVVEDLGPASCRLRAGSWSWVALAASLNRFDTDVRVVGPPELVAAFRVLADRNRATSA